MPIYEYACTACGERTEAKQSFTDPPLDTCELCSGTLRKLYSPVGIVFRGSGFYATDSKGGRSESKNKGSDQKSGNSSDTASKKETKASSDTKPASGKEASSS